MKKFLMLIIVSVTIFIFTGCSKNEKIKYDEYENEIYYSLFVRSFADSNNDGIGDLNGVTKNLDYFSDLGITAIWLLPIFESNTYHGYDTIDYLKINDDYGKMEDLENLIKAANKKNIKIILDLVINHTSDHHEWFLESKSNTSNDYREYYVWNNNTAYQAFPGGLMDLNLRSEKVKKEIFNIVDFYMNLGISGFRIDAVGHLFEEFGIRTAQNENIIFMAELNNYIKQKDSNAFIVGEVFNTDFNILKNYYRSRTSYFNFYVANEIKNKIGLGNSNYLFSSNLEKMYNEYKNIYSEFLDSPFIGNHDMDRVASINEFSDINKLKQAVNVFLTLPGSPFIYYGDEIGLKGKRYEGLNIGGKIVYDEYRRQPYLWGDYRTTTWLKSDGSNDDTKTYIEQKEDTNSLYNTYKDIIEIRKKEPALMFGNDFYSYSDKNIQGYLRIIDDENYQEAVLVIHNISENTIVSNLDYEIIFGSKEIKGYGTTIFKIPFKEIGEFK